jgi:hypothetical protein
MVKPIPTATSIDSNVKTLERYSYVECDGQVARRVKQCGATEVVPSGLRNGGKVTMVTLSAGSWTALPPTALTDRNAMGVQNQSDVEIKINYDNTESGYVGIIVPAGGQRFWDVTDAITIYAKSAAATPVVAVEEIS